MKYKYKLEANGILYFYDHNRGHASREVLGGCYLGACHWSRRGHVVNKFWHIGTPKCHQIFSPAARSAPVLLKSVLSRVTPGPVMVVKVQYTII